MKTLGYSRDSQKLSVEYQENIIDINTDEENWKIFSQISFNCISLICSGGQA